MPGLQTALDGKAPITHTQGISTITGLQAALDGKAPSVHSHAIADVTGLQPALDARVLSSTVGQPSGVASLGSDGKIPPGQIPSLAIRETFVVASEAAMLALTAQQGDVARRTDTGQTFILQTEPATTLANWVQISATAAVSTVNGESGDVTLTITDIPGLQTALDSKAASAHVHSGADITSGLVSVARLGAGTPSAANYLRGDGSWVAPNVAAITGLQTALDEKLATASNAASQGLVLTATGATAWEWKQPSGGGGTPVDANGHPVIGGVAPVAAVDWRGGVSEVTTGFAAFSGLTSAYRANSRRLYVMAGAPRLHFTADASGLLAEGQIRNYCAYNTSVTGWTVVSATVAAASGVNDPGGTAGAIQVDSTLSGGYTQQSVVSVPTEGAGNYAVSGFFRAGSASVVTLWLSGDNGATFSRCAFDLSTGIATPDSSAIAPSNIRVERYPNGWWYVGFVAALASVATTRIRIYPGGLAGAVGTVVFWGTQIAPAGYVPSLGALTSTAVGVKEIDNRSSALTTPLTPADSASIYAELYPGAAVDGCLFALGVTTGSKPRLEIRRTASGDGGLVRAFNAAGTQVFTQAITLGTGLARIAIAASSDSTLIAVNGSTFTVAASLNWLAMNRIAVGTDIDLLNGAGGALFLRLLLYPTALSIENLSALSLGGGSGGSSGGGSGGGGNLTWAVRTANATLAANENTFAKSGVTTLTLPSSISGAHRIANRSGAAITVQTQGGALIDGFATSATIASNTEAVIVADSGVWRSVNATVLIASQTFSYTGANQTFTVPNAIGARLFFYGIGAGGGGGSAPGGGGGAICLVLEIAASTDLANGRIAQGATLVIVVGQGGVFNDTSATYGGGGPSGAGGAGSGGGLTGLFLSSFTFPNALGVAGAGGGAANAVGRIGGAGGGITGENSTGDIPGTGGTQSAGGTSGSGSGGTAAGQLSGASATGTSYAGGGSGYYGGGAGLGGAGGSGYRLPAGLAGSVFYSGSGQTSAALYFPAVFNSSVGRGGNASSNGSNGAARIEVIPA
ncbi:glycine-rich protein [Limnothrix sp. PR1529]|uniref:phage head spike fiber domain-containing protein n=1 Tax=Limnothrix sp. PR1529 TaxID=1704291 RepID=UPI0034CDA2EE